MSKTTKSVQPAGDAKSLNAFESPEEYATKEWETELSDEQRKMLGPRDAYVARRASQFLARARIPSPASEGGGDAAADGAATAATDDSTAQP